MANQIQEREHFGSKVGVIMASAGSAIGLGNIWKFPYEVGNNGGAAFIMVYLACIVFIGLSIVIAEYVVGRRSNANAVGAFKKLAPNSGWWLVGMLGVLAAITILSFYGVVAGWTFEYLFQASKNAFVGKSPDELNAMFGDFVSNPYRPIIWQLIFMLLTCGLIYSGIKKGIERYTEILMPLLFVVIILLAIRAVTLPGGGEGIRFLFKPDFSAINGDVVLSALGHAFFSLSLGLGAIITYGSYVSKSDNLTAISIEVVALDTIIAIMAGIAIFPAVFAYGIEPTSGPSLVFKTLPNVFQQMPGGMLWGILFFFLLGVAALTSSVSLLEVVTAFVSEQLKIKRHLAIFLSALLITIIGIFCSLSQGPLSDVLIFKHNIFDLLDRLSANWMLPFGGLFTSLFVGWRMKKSDLEDELSNGGLLKVRAVSLLRFVLRWVAPTGIFIVFLYNLGVI